VDLMQCLSNLLVLIFLLKGPLTSVLVPLVLLCWWFCDLGMGLVFFFEFLV
jgi:hypothetical protein